MARSTASSRARPSRQPSLTVLRGVASARARGLEVGVLVVAARDVVVEDAAQVACRVEAGEERDDGEALHGQGQVLAHHLGQLVGLALEREGGALDLLVVLELHLEEADHLDRHAGRPRDGHRREAVGREDLLHGVVGDDVACRGAPVAGHHHAVERSAAPPRWCRAAPGPASTSRAGAACRPGPTSCAGGRRSPDPDHAPGERGEGPPGATAHPFARSCGRTPRRCPRAPRRSRRGGRRARP